MTPGDDCALVECIERQHLLEQLAECNREYRLALERCRSCRNCAKAPANAKPVCPLEDFLAKRDRAHELALRHLEAHGC